MVNFMKTFIPNNNIVSYEPIRNKSTLSGDIILLSNCLSLFEMVFATILYITLQRLMGLYSIIFLGFFAFGMRAIYV